MKLGVHSDISAAEYHANQDFIGSSTLTHIDESPRHFYHAWKGPAKEPTAAMQKGTLIHSLLLEQDISQYVPRPVNEKGDLVRSNSKEYAEFLAANPGKTPIHPDDYNPMYEMLTAFCENKRAMTMMEGARIEQSVFTKDPETGIQIKARPDIWGPGYLVDLKSTSNMRRFEHQIFEAMYDVRLVHYAKCIEFATGEKIDQFFFVAYESNAPYCSKIFRLKSADVERAEGKWRMFMNQVSVGMKTGKWPAYPDEIQMVTRPRFFEDETVSFEEVG